VKCILNFLCSIKIFCKKVNWDLRMAINLSGLKSEAISCARTHRLKLQHSYSRSNKYFLPSSRLSALIFLHFHVVLQKKLSVLIFSFLKIIPRLNYFKCHFFNRNFQFLYRLNFTNIVSKNYAHLLTETY